LSQNHQKNQQKSMKNHIKSHKNTTKSLQNYYKTFSIVLTLNERLEMNNEGGGEDKKKSEGIQK